MLNSQVDEIKSKLSVEEVISGYLALQKAGRNLKANCPFHNEKTPSFVVSRERQIWHCFGCGEGGDIFTFVMKMEGIEFYDALKLLAEKAGVKLENIDYKNKDKKSRLFEVNEISKKFYQECLKIKAGKRAYDYLLKRGLTKEIIEEFELGYAPDSWDLLSIFLKEKEYKDDEIFKAGITVKKDNGGYYDRFRGRIMFPINNISGQTIGFSSRIMPGKEESGAKYVNTPETLVYNKSMVLYGLDKARIDIKKEDSCIMVEGNMDVIASFQACVKNVVATSGTALTLEQVKIIKRYTDNISFAFDVDSAGINAVNRGIEIVLAEDININIIQVPEGKDPADCVKANPELWRETVKNPKQIMDFYFGSVFEKYDSSKIDDKKKIAQELLYIINKISNKIEQSHYLVKLSDKLNVDEHILSDILLNTKKQKAGFIKKTEGGGGGTKLFITNREDSLQERLLGLVIIYPEFFGNILDMEYLLSNKNVKKIYSSIKDLFLKDGKLDSANMKILKESLAHNKNYQEDVNDNLAFLWDTVTLSVEDKSENISGKIDDEIDFCVKSLRKINLQRELKELEKDIKNAEKENDYENQELLVKGYNRLLSDLNKLE